MQSPHGYSCESAKFAASIFNNSVMAVTRLKRKVRRNKARAANRINRLKQLTRKPVIKKLDTEDKAAVAGKSESKKTEEPQVIAAATSTSGEEE